MWLTDSNNILENNWRKSQKNNIKRVNKPVHTMFTVANIANMTWNQTQCTPFFGPSEKNFFLFTCCQHGTVPCYSGPSITFKFPWWSVPLDALWCCSICEYNSPTPLHNLQHMGERGTRGPRSGDFTAKTLGQHSISHKHNEMEAQTTPLTDFLDSPEAFGSLFFPGTP